MAKAAPEGRLRLTEQPGVSEERQLAETMLDPIAGGAAIATKFSKGLFGPRDLTAVYEALHEQASDVRSNKLSSVEDMLVGQAAALNAIFIELSRRSCINLGEYLPAAESYMRLALKAQGQCRATLETLAAIKNPPVVYARQANIAAGPQQVNNGAPLPCAGETSAGPNELLEAKHGEGEWLDGGAASTAGRSDPTLDAVGTIDGAAQPPRQGERQPQRVQRRQAARVAEGNGRAAGTGAGD